MLEMPRTIRNEIGCKFPAREYESRTLSGNLNKKPQSALKKRGPKSPERRETMEDVEEITQTPERSMIVVTDQKGEHWLCDEKIDPTKNLKDQGCWQCGDEHFAFTRDD